MVSLWVLGLALVLVQGEAAVYLHRSSRGSDVAIGHRRSLHTTEGHQEPLHHRNTDLPTSKSSALHHVALAGSAPIVPSPLIKPPAEAKKLSKAVKASRKKREPHLVETQSSAAVLGELGKILKDDDTEKKRIPPDVKRQATLKPNETIEDNTIAGDRKQQQTFEDWLRDEYFRNMALSIATVKRKRSSFDGRPKRSSRHEDAAGVAAEAKLRLQSLENAVLADALSEIVSRREEPLSSTEQEPEHQDSDLVARRLAQAYYLERLRGAVEKIEEQAAEKESWGAFEEEHSEPEDEPLAEDDQYTFDKRGNGNLAAVMPLLAPTEEKQRTEEEFCPALRMLTSDCSSLDEVLTEGEMSVALKHACNKHEVCYSCGEVFGLTSSSCDRVFLEDVSAACHTCSERALGQLLVPLRDQRVFYKRSVPALCYRAPCVQHYLEEHY